MITFRTVERLHPALTRIDYSLWLIGGSNGWYYDGNAAALHQHIRNNHPEIKIYWVMKKHSPHFTKVAETGLVVAHGSWKALWLSLKAGVLISTHSRRSDIADYARRYCKRALAVHLFHGVTALKRKTPGAESHYAEYDMLLATGPREKEIKMSFGCPEERIVMTGFPQHDVLSRRVMSSANTNRQILFLPTWRSWLAGEKYTIRNEMRVIEENYFVPILSLLRNEDLMKYCVANQVRVRLMIHRNMQFWWQDFVDRHGYHMDAYVDVLPPETSIQQELVAASLLVTDFSSVAWEFLYMLKPVVFYTFDLEQYLSKQGAYLEIPGQLFGQHAITPDAAARKVIEYMEDPQKFADNESVSRIRQQFFAYVDDRNSERVVSEIKKRLPQKLR